MGKEMEQYWGVMAIVLFWAIANCMQAVILDTGRKKTVIQIIANFILASFWGLVAGLIAKLVLDDIIWISVMAGIWGYAGVQGLNKLKDILFDTLIDLIKKNGRN